MFRRFDWEAKTGKGSSGLEDMVLISKISEDSIVDNLKKRYMDDLVYTYIGPILIAVNPYKTLPYYSEKEVEIYNGCTPHEVPPHIYALTDHMYRDMLIEEENQCVIISGESGAGKTVSAKYIMNYIAAVAPKAPDLENIKHVILESNPLLEAFGNAKTIRNNNSSRFGKYFQIEFTRGGVPDGGKISNFLLEKSRVTYQQSGERNFHIFYQMCKGCSSQEKEWLGLAGPEYFHFLRQGGTYDADGQDDPNDYKDTRNAMGVCGISHDDQNNLLSIAAGILHMGNVQFVERGNNAVVGDPATLEYPAYLLGISTEALNEKLTSRLMTTGGGSGRSSVYTVPLNIDQAPYTRNALAKSLYSRTFDWIVESINKILVKEKESICLGVLDIYGFEIFDKNGFEQFCINYVNEKLQQIFIELTLKAEQEEYASENIQWTPIDFFNNKIVCDLIESKKPVGIMAILDDICATMHGQSEGADSKFMQKLEAVSSHPHFTGHQNAFVIKHYAGNVTYDADGFVEANRDTLFKDLIQLMQGTTNKFIRNLFPEDVAKDDKKRPTTAAFKIKDQANLLVQTLMRCTPHYIRCIKPNETKKSKDWDGQRVLHQVRYLNLKENIRIRRAGYAYRQPFGKFLRRFAILTPETFPVWNGEVRQGIQIVMHAVELDNQQYQLGRTKVFIKAPESLFMMEELRARKYHDYAIKIQRAYRSWKARKYFLELKAQSQDVMYGQKERKRISLRRDYVGDYIGYLDNAQLRALVGKNEKVFFADYVTKYDRRFKPQKRTAIVTQKNFILIALEKAKEGPQKGKLVQIIKRSLPISQIQSMSVSTKADDFVVLHVPSEYDNVFETVFKTELVVVLKDLSRKNAGRDIQLLFSDSIQFTIKKEGFGGGGRKKLTFTHDPNARVPTLKSNGTVVVAPGLPKDSRNIVSDRTVRSQAPQAPRGRAPAQPGYQQPSFQQPSFQQPSYQQPQQHAYQAPRPAAPTGRPPAPRPPGAAAPASAPAPQAFRPPAAAAPAAPMGGMARAPAPVRPAGAAPPGARPAGVPIGARPPPGAGGLAKKPAPPPAIKPKLPTCRALYAYAATEADELSFAAGDIITITNKDNEGWWEGTCKGRKGIFPNNYIEMVS